MKDRDRCEDCHWWGKDGEVEDFRTCMVNPPTVLEINEHVASARPQTYEHETCRWWLDADPDRAADHDDSNDYPDWAEN